MILDTDTLLYAEEEKIRITRLTFPLNSLLTECYAFLDPAGGSTETKKASQAKSAITVVSVDHLARIFVLYAWADRISSPDVTEKVIDIQSTYHPKVFGIEASAQQSLFIGMVEHECLKRSISINIESVKQPTTIDKIERIRTSLQHYSRSGRLFLAHHMTQLSEELRSYPTGLTVDLVDSLASAVALIPPRRLAINANPTATHAAIAHYLTLSGRPDLIPLYTRPGNPSLQRH